MRLPARLLRRFAAHTGAATAIEYGLIAALISVVVVGAVTATGTALWGTLSNVGTRISNASH